MRYFIVSLICLCLATPALADSQTTLGQVLSRVMQTNPGLLAAREELQNVRELYPQAMAGWKPTLNTEASIFSTHIDNSNFGGADGATTKDFSLNLEQPLYRGGRTQAGVARARSLIDAAQAQLWRAEQDTLMRATQAYMDVIRDRSLYDLRQHNEKFLEEELQATREKLNAGFLTRTDVNQAEARLARARAETMSASGQLEASNATFEEAAGFSPIDTLYYPLPPANIPPTLDGLLAMIDKSPDIAMAGFDIDAAEHDIDRTFGELFPQLVAFASYNKQYDPQPGFIDDSQTETIGLRASMPLYDGGVIRSRTRQARMTVEKKRHLMEDTHRRLQADIVTQWKTLQSALAEIEARRTEIAASEMAREGVKAEAGLGERTVLDILDADQELLESRAALTGARRNEIVARYALAATLGLLVPAP